MSTDKDHFPISSKSRNRNKTSAPAINTEYIKISNSFAFIIFWSESPIRWKKAGLFQAGTKDSRVQGFACLFSKDFIKVFDLPLLEHKEPAGS